MANRDSDLKRDFSVESIIGEMIPKNAPSQALLAGSDAIAFAKAAQKERIKEGVGLVKSNQQDSDNVLANLIQKTNQLSGEQITPQNISDMLKTLSQQNVPLESGATQNIPGAVRELLQGKGFTFGKPLIEERGEDKARLILTQMLSAQGQQATQDRFNIKESRLDQQFGLDERTLGLRGEEATRRQEKILADNFNEHGGNIDSKESELLAKAGVDVSSIAEQFGLTYKIDKNGDRVLKVPNKAERDRLVSARTVTQVEQEFFQDNFNAIDTLTEVAAEVEALGITREEFQNAFKPKMEMLDIKGFGPMSIPANFTIISKFASDPKYIAVKGKLGRAFQAYRQLITGAQASDQEIQRLRPLIASFTDRPDAFFENVDSLVSESKRSVASRFDLMDAVGRDTQKLRGLSTKRDSKLPETMLADKFKKSGSVFNDDTKAELFSMMDSIQPSGGGK